MVGLARVGPVTLPVYHEMRTEPDSEAPCRSPKEGEAVFLPKFICNFARQSAIFGILQRSIGELDEDHISNYLSVKGKVNSG